MLLLYIYNKSEQHIKKYIVRLLFSIVQYLIIKQRYVAYNYIPLLFGAYYIANNNCSARSNCLLLPPDNIDLNRFVCCVLKSSLALP